MKFFGQEIFELSEELSGNLTDRGLRCGPQPVPGPDPDATASTGSWPSTISTRSCPRRTLRIVGAGRSGVPGHVRARRRLAGRVSLLACGCTPGSCRSRSSSTSGYAIEQLLSPREQPEFLGAVPADPPDAGLCDVSTSSARAARARAAVVVERCTGQESVKGIGRFDQGVSGGGSRLHSRPRRRPWNPRAGSVRCRR